jgi:hypothetical protein
LPKIGQYFSASVDCSVTIFNDEHADVRVGFWEQVRASFDGCFARPFANFQRLRMMATDAENTWIHEECKDAELSLSG